MTVRFAGVLGHSLRTLVRDMRFPRHRASAPAVRPSNGPSRDHPQQVWPPRPYLSPRPIRHPLKCHSWPLRHASLRQGRRETRPRRRHKLPVRPGIESGYAALAEDSDGGRRRTAEHNAAQERHSGEPCARATRGSWPRVAAATARLLRRQKALPTFAAGNWLLGHRAIGALRSSHPDAPARPRSCGASFIAILGAHLGSGP